MKCKKCQTELEQGVTLCPECGTENAENGKTGLGAGKIALLVILAVAAIAVVVALFAGGTGKEPAGTTTPVDTTAPVQTADPTETVPAETVPATIPADGNPDDVTCKGSYTADADQLADAASTVVATMGDAQLTNEELQVYYWMGVIDFMNQYYGYTSAMGLDLSKPMDTQLSFEGNMTWQQYFLDVALNTWHNYEAMAAEANANGYVLDQEYADYLAKLPDELTANAVSMGYESAEAMIQGDMGPGATLQAYLDYLNVYYLGYMYYGDTLSQTAYTEAEVEAYFDAHAEEYLQNGVQKSDECYVDVRHILISPEGGTTDESGATVYSDEEWAAAEKKANDVLNEWLSGEKTEESFAALAPVYSVDPGSSSNGGLYEDVYVGQMVPEFENWCFDASRQTGDYGIVKTSYGYHIMYFVRSDLVWFLYAEQDMMMEKGNAFLQEILEKHPAEIDYSAILIGAVDMSLAG